MPELSESTKKLINQYGFAQKLDEPKEGLATIHVDEVALRVAEVYEKIRTVVEWKEEHLMRRAAIIRKLKRRFFDLELNNYSDTDEISEALILELIRGGHFPNDKIEESKIKDIQNIISKYVFILKNNSENRNGKGGLNFYNWLLDVASCEIEEALVPAIREMALVKYMFWSMKDTIKVSDKIFQQGLLRKGDEDIQIYIAVCQALFKFDKPIISYNLIKYKYQNWKKADKDLILEVSKNIYDIWREIEKDLENPLSNKFYALCEKYDTPYLLLGDILLQSDPSLVAKEITNPEILETKIKEAYSKRMATLKTRISRAAIYSTISIFATKILSLVILEWIIDTITKSQTNFSIFFADIAIPTILMFLMVSSIKKPSKKNLNLVIMETMKIVYKREDLDMHEIKLNRKKSIATRIILSLVYVLSSFITFGGICYILNYLGFPITSIVIDIIFIALILFAGTALAKRAQELTMEKEKEGFLSFLSDVLFLPVQGFGKWISTTWKQYNAIAALFNALIDMPFSAFIEFLEGWRYFIKERKEEIR
jgi:hypothetical protein